MGYRGYDKNPFYFILSSFTLYTINFLGFPYTEEKQSLEVEVEVWNSKKEIIKRYTVNAFDNEYSAMYWGYTIPNLSRKLAADNIKQALEQIRLQINNDADEIKKKLK